MDEIKILAQQLQSGVCPALPGANVDEWVTQQIALIKRLGITDPVLATQMIDDDYMEWIRSLTDPSDDT